MGRVYKRRRKRRDGTVAVSKKWSIEYSDENGREVRRSASTDKQIARSLLRKAEERVERIRLGLEVSQPDLTLRELAERFLEDMRLHLRPRSLDDYKTILEELVLKKDPEIKAKRPSQLTVWVIQEYQARARETFSARTVNKKVTALGTMLNWAVSSQLLRSNPIQRVRMLPSEPERKQRALTDEEVSELLKAADEETRDVWILFLETGLRKKELATLRWEDVDLERGSLEVRREVAKSKRARKIPLRPSVIRIFERLRGDQQHPSGVILAKIRGRGFYNYVLAEFDRDREAANIDKEGVHIHCLRRTFATRLIRAGADPKTVQTLLGHSTLEMTLQLYTDAKALDLRGWMDQLPDLEVREPLTLYLPVA